MSEKDDKPEHVFDSRAATAQLGAVSAALLAARRARQAAKEASTARQFALNAIRSLEPIIYGLFEDGSPVNEVLALIQSHLPAVPPGDLRYALAQIRERHRLHERRGPELAVSNRAAPPRTAPASAPTSRPAPPQAPAAKRPAAAPPASGAAQPAATNSASPAGSAIAALGLTLPPWADGSDKLSTESDEDYVLRKNLETPPDHRRRFIGEHNS